ncbi:MAG: hypothetical protein D6806_13555 [Deltaproteobacteria bacterium]|nr:MAG: hypothetical protein D6806_13555 [Deltaproteobacteria bacterium]
MTTVSREGKHRFERRLLDLWTPPPRAGEPLGCLATSFTFSAALFEEECLSRFAGIESDPEADGTAWLIEREERLANLACAAALVDVRHCRGARSLRWDLVPVRVPGAAMHAKVSLLAWSEHVRLIVSSANLTHDGYRRNQEVAGVLDFHDGADSPLTCLGDALDFLYMVLRFTDPGPARDRCRHLLEEVSERAAHWGSRNDKSVHWIQVAPRQPNAIERIEQWWRQRTGARPDIATVVSPFFDPPARPDNPPAHALWSMLRQRGAAEVRWCMTVGASDEGTVHLHAPESIRAAMPGRESVHTRYLQVREEVPTEQGAVHRPLHAKILQLENAHWVGCLIGSSNFTSSGLGFSRYPNLEANLFYLAHKEREPKRAAALRASLVGVEEILAPPELWRWEPLPDESEAEAELPTLPTAFSQAIYTVRDSGARLILKLSGSPPAGWRLFEEGAESPLLDEKCWIAQGRPVRIQLPWPPERLPPAGLEVSWAAVHGRARWPVQIEKAEDLPPPQELRGLDLDTLIHILTSARPLHLVLRKVLQQRSTPQQEVRETLDPHKRVDTRAFLIQRARRVAWALRGLRQRLEAPVYTEAALAWRLGGPVGPLALARALRDETRVSTNASRAQSDPRERAAECAFLLAELALELAHVVPAEAPGSLPAARVREALHEHVERIGREALAEARNAEEGITAYVRKAIAHAWASRGEQVA